MRVEHPCKKDEIGIRSSFSISQHNGRMILQSLEALWKEEFWSFPKHPVGLPERRLIFLHKNPHRVIGCRILCRQTRPPT